MPRLAYAIEIARPPDVVFDFLDDFSNDALWRANVVEMVPLGREDDPMGKWATQIERRQVPGRVIETEAILTARERPRRLAFGRASGPIRPVGIYRLEARDDGTHLEFELGVDLQGGSLLLMPLVWILLNVIIKPTLPADFARLKRRLELNPSQG